MPLVLRALLVLVLVLVLGLTVSMQGARLRGASVRLVLDPSGPPRPPPTCLCHRGRTESPVWSLGCLSLQGGAEDAGLEAKPIHHQVLVLHKISKQRPGTRRRKWYGLSLGTEVISVGCTCVRPSVVHHLCEAQ